MAKWRTSWPWWQVMVKRDGRPIGKYSVRAMSRAGARRNALATARAGIRTDAGGKRPKLTAGAARKIGY